MNSNNLQACDGMCLQVSLRWLRYITFFNFGGSRLQSNAGRGSEVTKDMIDELLPECYTFLCVRSNCVCCVQGFCSRTRLIIWFWMWSWCCSFSAWRLSGSFMVRQTHLSSLWPTSCFAICLHHVELLYPRSWWFCSTKQFLSIEVQPSLNWAESHQDMRRLWHGETEMKILDCG